MDLNDSDTQTNTHAFSQFLPPVGHGRPPGCNTSISTPTCTVTYNGLPSTSGAMPHVSLQGTSLQGPSLQGASVTCTQSNIPQHFITSGVPSMSGLLSNGVVPQSLLQGVQYTKK